MPVLDLLPFLPPGAGGRQRTADEEEAHQTTRLLRRDPTGDWLLWWGYKLVFVGMLAYGWIDGPLREDLAKDPATATAGAISLIAFSLAGIAAAWALALMATLFFPRSRNPSERFTLRGGGIG